MSDIEIPISFPLDSDGFLRRACPSCCREFKWLSHTQEVVASPTGKLFCPYCGAPGAPNGWFTTVQLAYINEEVFDEVVRPSLQNLAESFRQLGRSSGGMFKFTGNVESPQQRQAPPVFEPADMRQVNFNCHPSEPVKVEESWDKALHCLSCGNQEHATPQ